MSEEEELNQIKTLIDQAAALYLTFDVEELANQVLAPLFAAALRTGTTPFQIAAISVEEYTPENWALYKKEIESRIEELKSDSNA